jgi:hypothetical protein
VTALDAVDVVFRRCPVLELRLWLQLWLRLRSIALGGRLLLLLCRSLSSFVLLALCLLRLQLSLRLETGKQLSFRCFRCTLKLRLRRSGADQ